ncbi:lipoate--protein ligase family protein [uncultured Parabacteroides sp.]|uniref:lipoate--protein ligase family protein n=1 Tax=uncultured Parabacteroides sp. TaxID=512312 RepID=UPI00263299B4|nr:lipoate--protein ligase family protein [uncultured Parabacteroides sp.]
MLCIHNTQTDPYFNLAAEEYLLKSFKDNIFMLWQNEPSIIIGKHQDVWTEVNLKFVQDQQITIARRLSGGSAVYHDPGNLNLTFIENGQIIQTDKHTIQIMNFLRTLGVHVTMDGWDGLAIGGFKISGSAQSIHKNRYLHHATLLFSTDLDRLVTSLKNTSRQTLAKTRGKRSTFVKSVRSPVTNIRAHLPASISIQHFKKALLYYFTINNPGIQNYSFTQADLEAIYRLKERKYATTSWNFNTYTL